MKQEFVSPNGDRVMIELPDEPELRVASAGAKAKSRAVNEFRWEFFRRHRRAASGAEIMRFSREWR